MLTENERRKKATLENIARALDEFKAINGNRLTLEKTEEINIKATDVEADSVTAETFAAYAYECGKRANITATALQVSTYVITLKVFTDGEYSPEFIRIYKAGRI